MSAFDCLNPFRQSKTIINLTRDEIGLKSIFYTKVGDETFYASRIDELLAKSGQEAKLDLNGLAELLALGPARYEHSGIFKDIYALPPGYRLKIELSQTKLEQYWDFPNRPHPHNEEDTVAHVRKLLTDAVLTRLDDLDNTCAMLSGGVDSSVITAIAAEAYKEAGKQLHTFSFDFTDSETHFQSNAFQHARDRPWVDKMVSHCNTHHHYIECNPQDLADALYPAVDARDLPGMADVDASFLYFCSKIPFKYALTGEAADEIFNGYPWFHTESSPNLFPWSQDFETRKILLKDEWIEALHLEAVAAKHVNQVKCSNKVEYLTLKWFMPTLLERTNRMGAYSGLEGIVPFADLKLMEYVWNIPEEMKNKNGIVKYILREASRGFVPEDVLFRKKSPFPKTYDPKYTAILAERLYDVIANPASPILAIIDVKKTRHFIDTMLKYPNLSRPWYGQLMAGPQMLAYVLQLDYWLRKYKVQMLF